MSHQNAAAAAAAAAEGWIGSVALPKVPCLVLLTLKLHDDSRVVSAFALLCVHACCWTTAAAYIETFQAIDVTGIRHVCASLCIARQPIPQESKEVCLCYRQVWV